MVEIIILDEVNKLIEVKNFLMDEEKLYSKKILKKMVYKNFMKKFRLLIYFDFR
jgi:hypothetical protein